nr:uncharacterized protein LOC107396330 isoform X2 [Nothobranchius furzeri]
MTHNECLRILDDDIKNQRLTAKLPDWLSSRWNRKATQYQLEHGKFPDFKYFVTFLTLEASISCNPVTSYYALRQGEQERTRSKPQNVVTPKSQAASARIFTTNTTEKNISTCMFCKKTGHVLHKCRRLTARPVADRVKFIQGEKLCFGCMSPGHQSKNCSNRMVCDTCSKRHPTCLHEDRSKQQENDGTSCIKERTLQSLQDTIQETTSNRVVHDGNSAQTSAIVPVYASMPGNSNKEVLVYALLDSQSDSSFILEEVVDALDVNAEPVKLKLSTMSSKETIVPCKRIKGLQIRGLSSFKKITVPTVYTREFIPANRTHIPTSETARAWPHLEHLAEHIAPPKNCEIGLLIGYNCPQALMPREVVCGEDNQPFAQKTDVGWSIVSYGDPSENYSDAIGVSHRIIVRQVIPEPKVTSNLKSNVHYVFKTRIKELTAPEDVLKVLESYFSESIIMRRCSIKEEV